MLSEEDRALKLEREESTEEPIHKLADKDKEVAACDVANIRTPILLSDVPVQRAAEQTYEDGLAKLRDQSLRLSSREDHRSIPDKSELSAETFLLAARFLQVERWHLHVVHFFEDFLCLEFLVLREVLLDLINVFLLLRVVDRQLAHEEITWVQVARAASFRHLEIVAALLGRALIDDVAVCQENQSITEAKSL